MAVGRLIRVVDWEKLAREAKFHPAGMADLCSISVRQMERFFMREFKTSPREWARVLRCRLARQLIAEGWSSKAVIADLGFVDGSHLGREFRKFYGVAPQTVAPLFTGVNPSRASTAVIVGFASGVGKAPDRRIGSVAPSNLGQQDVAIIP
jgi:transcriptional regulator GlxA family with amidase domain